MQNQIYLDAKQVPAQLLCGYTGRQIKAVICDAMRLTDTSWAGGTRSTYQHLDIKTGQRSPISGNAAPTHFGGNQEGRRIEITPGHAIAERSMFCGKDMGLVIHLHIDDAKELIPEPDTLATNEKIVLAATAGLKASYGGIKNFRFTEAERDTGITEPDWDSAKAELISRKLLNKAGAITVTGRNAIGGTRLFDLRPV